MQTKLEDELLVENGTAFLVERRVIKKAAIRTLVEQIKTRGENDYEATPLLPAVDGGCRCFVKVGRNQGFLMQSNPDIRKISYVNSGGRGFKDFEVSVPWIWILCKFSVDQGGVYHWAGCWLCSTYRNLQSMSDPVFLVPLPNQYDAGHGNMCTGDHREIEKPTTTPALTCKMWQMHLFNSIFNSDLGINWPSGVRGSNNYEILENWASKSKENRGFGISPEFGLRKYGVGDSTLDAFLRHAMTGGRH